MTNCSTLVLDFDGVISHRSSRLMPIAKRRLALPPGTLNWRGPFDPDNDPLWCAMQAGEISQRDYWYTRARETGKLVGEECSDLPSFLRRVRGAEPDRIIRPEAGAAIETASTAGKTLAILSNELDLFYGADFRVKLPLLKKSDLIVDATYSKILKPDPRACAAITEGLDINAQDCVFIDDRRNNYAGACDFNMVAVHFDVKEPLAGYNEALAHLGVPPLPGDFE